MHRLYDYVASANCYKIRLLLTQLGLEYERVPIDIFAGDTLTAEYTAINPARSTPVLEVRPGCFLPESNAILLYLADGTPFLPDSAEQRAQAYRWLFFEQADVVPMIGGLRFRLLTGRLKPSDQDAHRRRAGAAEVLQLLDAHLAQRDFLLGPDYGVADIGVYGYVHVTEEAGISLEQHEAVRKWLGRVESRPNYMNDLEPYPPNARPGAGRSIYG
jgi:glutathione S-transferase